MAWAFKPKRQEARSEPEAAGAGLPFKQRIVVALFYLQDMDVEEIADVLGVPEGTVKSRLYYGRARLRKALTADVRVAFDAMPRTVGA